MANKPKLTDVKGVASSRAKQLEAIGIHSVEDLAGASPEKLTSIAGISPGIAANLLSAAATLLRVREITDDEPDTIEVSPELLQRLRNHDDDDQEEQDHIFPPAMSAPGEKKAKKDKPKKDKPKKDKSKKDKKADSSEKALKKAEKKAAKKAREKAEKAEKKAAKKLKAEKKHQAEGAETDVTSAGESQKKDKKKKKK